MRKKSLISLLLVGSLILSLTGCAGRNTEQETYTEEIELLEPVNSEVSYEEAAIRSLYEASTYAAAVVPHIEECTPENGMLFRDYAAYPGETVKKGQELMVSDTTNIDEQIKAKEEYITSMEENQVKYLENQKKLLDKYREDEALWKFYVDLNERQEPQQYIEVPKEEGSREMIQVENPQYAAWEEGYNMVTGRYRIAKHGGDTVQLQIDQRTAVYELDRKHQEYLLEQLRETRKQATVTSQMEGTLVAMKLLQPGNYLQKDVAVAAVGDLSQKLLKCDYINRATIKKASDVYALIDGRRYEVEYQAMTPEEYKEITADGSKAYSTFVLKDAGDEVEIGDFAVIAVISSARENVVTIPKGAIRKDDSGSFVYVLKDGQSVYASIQTDFSDGVYTEVTYGLEAGDKVLYSGSQTPGKETAVLARGEFHTEFSNRAWMEYPSTYYLTNPVENGTVYYGEAQVRLYQHVEKGDVIATVRVEPDNIALSRNETKLSRLQERLADFQKNNKENSQEDYYIETVKSYREQMEELQETIARQKADFATTQIRADRSGVVVEMKKYREESIVQRGENMLTIADESTCYVLMEDTNQLLQFGNRVQVEYMDEQNRNHSVEGMVVSMSRMGVSKSLQQEYAFILLPKDKIGEIMQTAGADDGWWSRFRYTVKASLRSMDNVLMVPKRAVYDLGGKTYVYIKDENGNVKAQSFVSGGYNDQYYWVVQGLTEGMEVCLK